jgi:hypothetical protein
MAESDLEMRSLAAVEAALVPVSSADTLFDQRDLWHAPGYYDGALQAKTDVARQSKGPQMFFPGLCRSSLPILPVVVLFGA